MDQYCPVGSSQAVRDRTNARTREAIEVVAGWLGKTKAVSTEFLLEETSNGPCCARHVKIHLQRRSSNQSSGAVAEFKVIAAKIQALVHSYAMDKGICPQFLNLSLFRESEDRSGVRDVLCEGQVALLFAVAEQNRRSIVI
jgi:hypothetical protein